MDTFDRFVYFIKKAAPEDVFAATSAAGRYNRPTPVSDAIRDTLHTDHIRDAGSLLYAPVRPFVNALNDVNPFSTSDIPTSYSLGAAIGRLTKTPFYNPNDLGPYEQMVDYLKKTEESEMLLREARKLRRKARILKDRKAREEELKKHVEDSRYF